MKKRLWAAALALLLLFALVSCEDPYDPAEPTASGVEVTLPSQAPETETPAPADPKGNAPSQDENGVYDSKEDVSLYLQTYGELPDNYVTKQEAEEAGWSGGNVERYTGEGTAIGGSTFGNREGLLPKEQGRTYTECDIDTVGENSRGTKRIVFSNDGLVYYTDDHYESFELVYAGDGE